MHDQQGGAAASRMLHMRGRETHHTFLRPAAATVVSESSRAGAPGLGELQGGAESQHRS